MGRLGLVCSNWDNWLISIDSRAICAAVVCAIMGCWGTEGKMVAAAVGFEFWGTAAVLWSTGRVPGAVRGLVASGVALLGSVGC